MAKKVMKKGVVPDVSRAKKDRDRYAKMDFEDKAKKRLRNSLAMQARRAQEKEKKL